MSSLNDKVILTYALSDDEVEILNKEFEGKVDCSCIVIKEAMGNSKIKDILSGESKEDDEFTMPLEKTIIFNNFPPQQLQASVKKVRAILESRPILATVTPISINWRFHKLLEHLVEEREQIKNSTNRK
ncbi:hypothetical protein U732_2107 [Clostridium argentinense CDC 2741]|uniref:DUF3783 domain-containing protein n=1 Tax=Clostridium argentinense CDC 2741 TaxID=1418104 RepID=A0A0C1TYD8_9CLOT|nr:DUF3783 domain-containing protein [Clostridium argentinense]ARC83553.1 hypothetical protein RSJ17_02840 [Clostridium argentinense]KIE45719.1 hypothetical protein U732_2107 [Clostridium argentinense CDC 2741]NFF40566.1 DUF3783 domain-containing protein [Clostridium argentinense]NFP50884.1 DUF3783 domain-containing protein [Clostridium argentinense]NFP74303.1 DUF3783 domain-containing protein [Clostridium argentinense]